MNSNETLNDEKLKPIYEEVQTQVQSRSLAGRLGSALKLTVSDNMALFYTQLAAADVDKLASNRSALSLYLSSSLMRRPKFSNPSYSILCCKLSKKARHDKARRFHKAEERLDHDLDIRTILRTNQKVQGLINSVLDDKQRVMLKFQMNRVISLNENDDDELPIVPNMAQTTEKMCQQMATGALGPVDRRLLKGLTSAKTTNVST